MAILTGPEIKRQIEKGAIVIKPYNEKFVGPNSVDVHLGDKLLMYRNMNRVRIPGYSGMQIHFHY